MDYKMPANVSEKKDKSTILKHERWKVENFLVCICLCWKWDGVHLPSFGTTFIFITINGIKGDYRGRMMVFGQDWSIGGKGSQRVHYGFIIKGCEMKVHLHLLSSIKGEIEEKKKNTMIPGGKWDANKYYISLWLIVEWTIMIGEKFYNNSSDNNASCRFWRSLLTQCFNTLPFL